MSVRLDFSGLIFNESARTAAMNEVVHDVLDYGKDVIAQKTPVDTGVLQAGWMFDTTSIFNNVPYVGFIEDGTIYIEAFNMAKDSRPEIESYLIRRLGLLLTGWGG